MLTPTRQPPTIIEPRFSGLPGIAHGGYVGGIAARALAVDAAEVRLRRPVPVGRRLDLQRIGGERVELLDGEMLLAEAVRADVALDVPPPVTLAEAEAASARYPGVPHHLFPDCFACGPGRAPDDGLHVCAGPVAGRRLAAADWRPSPALADATGHVPAELVWAALDCAQLWSLLLHVPGGTPDSVVTAALATRLERPVVAGEPYVLIAWPIGREGRTWTAGAAVFGPRGDLCAVGRQTAAIAAWGVPLGRDRWTAGVPQRT